MEVKLFGILAEKAGAQVVHLNASDTESLRVELRKIIPEIDSMSYAVAVDRKVINGIVNLKGEEEIAVLPPFAGG